MIRSIIATIYSLFWCGMAVITLMLFPKSSDFVLRQYAKRLWSKPMLRWIVGAKINVELSPLAHEASYVPKSDAKIPWCGKAFKRSFC